MYDYQFYFVGDFDQGVYDAFDEPDDHGDREQDVRRLVSDLKYILQVQPGIREISSFCNCSGSRLKVTVMNAHWTPP